MPKRKANVEKAEGVRQSKALGRTLPMLPDEVLCGPWCDAVDAHEPELWLARCNALELLPSTAWV